MLDAMHGVKFSSTRPPVFNRSACAECYFYVIFLIVVVKLVE